MARKRERNIEKLNVARFRAYLSLQAALLLASEDDDTRSKGRLLTEGLLFDKRLQ